MLTDPITKNDRVATGIRSTPGREEEALRLAAIRQLERVRSFKLHVAAFLLGMPILTGI